MLNIVDSKYELVHIAARRSKEISRTGHYQMSEGEYKCKKNIGRALEEVEKGLQKSQKNNPKEEIVFLLIIFIIFIFNYCY